jgi:hypothetical protein
LFIIYALYFDYALPPTKAVAPLVTILHLVDSRIVAPVNCQAKTEEVVETTVVRSKYAPPS